MSPTLSFAFRKRRRRWAVTAATVVTLSICLLALLVATPILASSNAGARAAREKAKVSTSAPRGLNPRLAACESRHVLICDAKAYNAMKRNLPLAKPDPRGARRSDSSALMTESQAIASQGWTGDSVGAALMTYGQAQASYPALAAETSLVVDPSREVWVMTRHFATPTVDTYPRDYSLGAGYAPVKVSAESVVIDALTGDEPDACSGCAVIPAS
jgi:hypothetical protein